MSFIILYNNYIKLIEHQLSKIITAKKIGDLFVQGMVGKQNS